MAEVDSDLKTDDLSAIYNDKLENINKIRNHLQSLLTELDDHDAKLSKGLNDIQSLIDAQRNKFENLSNKFNQAQKVHNDNKAKQNESAPNTSSTSNPSKDNPSPNNNNNGDDEDTKAADNDDPNDDELPIIDIKLDALPPIPSMKKIELPPKREPITIIPFERMNIDFDFLNQQMEIANNAQLNAADDPQYDDIKQTDDELEEKKEEMEDPTSPYETDAEEEEYAETEDEDMDETTTQMLEQEKVLYYILYILALCVSVSVY